MVVLGLARKPAPLRRRPGQRGSQRRREPGRRTGGRRMKQSKPYIGIPVDLTNPGQFFACCGLLELADRIWPGAEGWFECDRFQLRFDPSFNVLVDTLRQFTVTNTMSATKR